MAKRFLLIAVTFALLFVRSLSAAKLPQGEWIIVVGGVSMHQWEKYKAQPHDHWWANFVHAARIRTEQLRAELGENAMITWLVYKPGYLARAQQDGTDLIANINSVRDAYHLNLVYFNKGGDVINYLNNGQPRTELKIAGFEYFGHSNKACFMFDYSNVVDSSSKAWMHENDLKQIDRRIFARGAFVKSWGCHTGEQMSKYWYDATGTRMWAQSAKRNSWTTNCPFSLPKAGNGWTELPNVDW